MKIAQFHVPGLGLRLGRVEGHDVIDITCPSCATTLDLLRRAVSLGITLDEAAQSCPQTKAYSLPDLEAGIAPGRPHLLLPIDPPEVWGCGVTYLRSAATRDADASKDIYTRVYHSRRPEIFFKATASRCVGPGGQVGIRSDSDMTAAEPELAFLLGDRRRILGYTICDDVSAWDLERENPLYLPQSKTFLGCCAIGPYIATPSSVPDPYALHISCRLLRGDQTLYEGQVHSSQIKFRFEELAEFLCRSNPVPPGTVVSTGTGIMIPNEFCLRPGDRVEIEIEGIGRLVHGVRRLTD